MPLPSGCFIPMAGPKTIPSSIFWLPDSVFSCIGKATGPRASVSPGLRILINRCGKQGNHDFVVTGNGVTAAAGEHRPLDHIDAGPVVLNHVKIGRGEILDRVTQVACHGQRL
jgi:hypothetical protein